MAAPTQEYPPWLSPSPYPTTLVDGDVETATSIIYLPLTYYGPSIPLGTGVYTYGGLTSPASTESASTQETSSIETSTATPSSLTLFPSSATPSSTFSSSPTTSASSSTSSSSSLNSTTTPAPSSSSPNSTTLPPGTSSAPPAPAPASGASASFPSQAQLAGIVVGSVMAAMFLCLLFYCLWKRAGVWMTDFVIVTPGDISPGEGSPRHSGEEADPFLDRSRFHALSSAPQSAANSSSQRTQSTQLSYTSSGHLSNPHFGGDENPTNTEFGLFQAPNPSNTRSSHTMSDLGTPIERTGSPTAGFIGLQHTLTSEELRQHDHPSTIPELPEPSEESPLMPPPRLVDPGSLTGPQGSLPLSKRSFRSNRSSLPVDTDAAMLQTARRVNIEDELGMRPRSSLLQANIVPTPSAHEHSTPAGGWLPALGLGGLANRLTWFTNSSDPDSRRNSMHNAPPSAWSGPGVVDRDVEAGRPLLTAPSQEFRSTRGIIGVGIGPAGSRPHSGADSSVNSNRSNVSGQTIYHDAVSDLPPPPIARASPPTSIRGSPAMQRPVLPHVASEPTLPVSGDILDTPAPTALRSFASSSSMRDTGTSRTGDSTTDSSLASKAGAPFLPPGLTELAILPKIWTETSGRTPSPGSYGAGTPDEPPHVAIPLLSNRSSVTIDVLEEDPPVVQRSFARILGFHIPPQWMPGVGGDRSTFGGPTSPTLVYSSEMASEVGSLHSSRSHLSPIPARSIGSSGGTHSKESSQRSRRTGSSSLSHSGSISSDGRRRGRLGTTRRDQPAPHSPALSALGEQNLGPASPPLSPLRALSPELRPVSPSSVTGMPWATGLDESWNAS
ncbi:hypothetical protein DL96DRAFT_1813658 [Flagelloscypha sp. PMI_526]|nr:hypothetical protein DL96DRAFT_1813658 [Flagelloscypha sp. PMI_526]